MPTPVGGGRDRDREPPAGIGRLPTAEEKRAVLAVIATPAGRSQIPGTRNLTAVLSAANEQSQADEALALTWPDVDFTAGRVSITKSLEEIDGRMRVKSPKTKRAVRQIDITPSAVAALNSHRRAMLAEGRDVRAGVVFVNTVGTYLSLSNLHRDTFKPLLMRAGLPSVSLYALRHTCETLLLLANVNPKIVSERLGHSSITLTLDTYSHVLPTMQRAAADVLAKVLAGNS